MLTYAPDGLPARAYPIRYLMWHEIVNDTVAGRPIAVTFCPLCNTGMIFDRRIGGQTLSFGVSGLLRNSDMIMYDLRDRKLVAAGGRRRYRRASCGGPADPTDRLDGKLGIVPDALIPTVW